MKHLRFSGLEAGTRTWFETADGGLVHVNPNEMHPLHVVHDPDYYVRAGMAEVVGDDDGTDGRVDRLEDELRELFARYGFTLPGRKDQWKLRPMLAKVAQVLDGHEAAVQDWEAAEAARREAEEQARRDAEAVPVDEGVVEAPMPSEGPAEPAPEA